jgi:hypothetical protein
MKFSFATLFGALGHNGLAAAAGIAVPLAANALQSAVSGSPYLATHSGVQFVVGLIVAAVTRDLLKIVPAFAKSSGTIAATTTTAPLKAA